jgi:uncharacterized protein (TIGR02453 family)
MCVGDERTSNGMRRSSATQHCCSSRTSGRTLRKLNPHFVADPRPTRGSLYRIYRDTRFSPDKRPFKTHVGIHFSHASGKDAHAPVFYLHLEPDNCFAAAGVWHPDGSA